MFNTNFKVLKKKFDLENLASLISMEKTDWEQKTFKCNEKNKCLIGETKNFGKMRRSFPAKTSERVELIKKTSNFQLDPFSPAEICLTFLQKSFVLNFPKSAFDFFHCIFICSFTACELY